ncbi:YhdP family protein [Neptunomonas antarctica]|uniref:TIGR02099 family protein n=1 Tax=Neptunomonas antarctica TaxID=619304 RepID=A0A1N7NWV8_9GAMM|nr:YhdP family protein [Neptunomonas antarctica]SIT02814.1 TIGR02099 family protein [Neptunomonas antarctica]
MLSRISRWVGWAILALLLLVATLVGTARQFLPSIAEHKSAIESYLSNKTGMAISVGGISAQWQGRYPTFLLRDIKSYSESAVGPEVSLSIRQVDAEIDLLASLVSLIPVFAVLNVDQTDVSLRQKEGRWSVDGDQSAPENMSAFVRQIINVLTQQPEVSFTNARLTLFPEQGKAQQLSPITFRLNNAGDQHHLYGSLALSLSGAGKSQVEFAIETENLPLDPLAGDYQLYAKVSNLGQQLLSLDLVDLPFSIQELDMGTELWGRWRNHRIESLQGKLQIDRLSFEEESLESISDSSLIFTVQPGDQHSLSLQQFHLTITDLLIQNGSGKLVAPYISAELALNQGKAELHQIALKELDLGVWSQWFSGKPYLPEILNDALHKLNPQGSLKNLTVVWPDANDLSKLQGEADLYQVSVDDYYGAPILKNVSGRLGFTESTGEIDLNSENFSMGFPGLFAENWEYARATGKVSWLIEERVGHTRPVVTVKSDLLGLESAALKAAGRFSMYLPLDRTYQTELTLMIGLKGADGRQASLYIPPEEVGESLHRWVSEAIQGGTVNDGMLVLRAGTRAMDDRLPPTVQLYFDVSDATVKFQPDWPVISETDLTLSLDQGALSIKANRGRLLNSQASMIDVQLPAHSTNLSIKTSVAGEAKDILTLLRTTPLHDAVGKGLDDWSLTGQHKTDVHVVVPLAGNKQPLVTVNSHLENGRFEDKTANLLFEKVAGDIGFSSEKGLFSENIRAVLMNAPVTARIEPLPKTKDSPALTRVFMTGKVGVPALKKQTELSFLASAEGAANIRARLDICSGSPLCNKLVIDSDLRGISIQAPAPLGKNAAATLPLQIVGQLGIAESLWRYNLGGQLRGVTKLLTGASRTRIAFGGKRPQEPAESGIWVDGNLDEVDLAEFQAFMARNGWWDLDSLVALPTASPSNTPDQEILDQAALNQGELNQAGLSQDGLKQLVLSIKRVKAGEIQINDLDLVVNTTRSGNTVIGFVSPGVTGEIRMPSQLGKPYQVNLDHWYLKKPSILASTTEGNNVLDTREWPSVDLSIKKLYLNAKPFGQWAMKIRPDSVGQLTLDSISGQYENFEIKGAAGWRLFDRKPESFMKMTLEGEDFGKLLADFDYNGVLESETINMSSDFTWSGYPWGFELNQLNGSFKMLLKKGRIIETGEQSNILRLFGILNLNTIVRRLKLNFTDLVEKGVAFDRVSADYLLDKGIASSQVPLTLSGPSANVNMTGRINLVEQTLDSQMDVVLPVTSNLPIAAVLLGAPQIAGAVFLLDKLIGDKFEKVSTLTYRLRGSWADPDINIVTPGSALPEPALPDNRTLEQGMGDKS